MMIRPHRVRLMAWRTRALRGTVLFTVLLLTVALAFVYMVPRPNSFLVEASTYSATINYLTGAQRNNWRLAPGVTICRWVGSGEVEPLGAASESEGSSSGEAKAEHDMCPETHYYVTETRTPLGFFWPAGSEIELLSGRNGALVVEILSLPDEGLTLQELESPIEEWSRLIVPREVFLESGILPFSGEITIGRIASAGERRILQQGSYSIRERLPARSNHITVSSGELNRGDEVTFKHRHDEDATITNFGFVSAFQSELARVSSVPFELVSYTELEHTEMRLQRYASVPNVIYPRWTGRAANDPLLLGLTVVLTFAALCISIVAESYLLLAGRNAVSESGDNSSKPGYYPAKPAVGNNEHESKRDRTHQAGRSAGETGNRAEFPPDGRADA